MATLEEQIQALSEQLNSQQPPTLPELPRGSPADPNYSRSWTGLLGEALSGGQGPGYRLRGAEGDNAANRALLNFGINMLMASGPQRYRPDLGSAFGAGLQGAQQSMDLDQRRAQAVAQQDYTQRMELAKLGVEQGRDRTERLKAALTLLTMQQREQQRQQILGTSGGTPAGDYSSGVAGIEGTGKDPRSSAVSGFIDNTWKDFVAANPNMFTGMTPEQVMAARNDPAMVTKAPNWYAQQNAPVLSAAGITPSGQTLGIAHRVGPGAATRLLKAPDDAKVGDYLDAKAVAANPELATMTVGQLKAQYSRIASPAFLSSTTAPGSRPTASTTPAGPPGVQMGGPPPAPPGSRDTGVYTGGGIGSVLNPDVAKTSPTLRGPGAPDPGKVRADVEAIQAGTALAQATPLVDRGGATAGPGGVPAQTRGYVPGQPEGGWGSAVGSYGGTAPTAPAMPAQPTPSTGRGPAAPGEPPAPGQGQAAIPRYTRPHPFEPTLAVPPDDPRFATVLSPQVEEDFRRRLQLNESQLRTRIASAPAEDIDKIVGEHDKAKQDILKDRTAALTAQLKDQGKSVAEWQKEERERLFGVWKDERYPAEPSDLAAAKITPQPGVIYQVDNQGNIHQQKVEVDPRLQRQAEDDYKTFQTSYQQPYTQLIKIRPIMDQMDALRQRIMRNGGAATGLSGEYLRHIQQAAASVGFASEGFGNLNDVQVLESLANQVVLAMKQGVALGNTSNMDLQIVGSQVPTMLQTLAGQEKLSAVLRQIWDHQERVYKVANKEIRNPGTGYTFRDLDERVAEAGPAIPLLPAESSTWDRKQFEDWRTQHKLRKGQVYYTPDGQIATVMR